MSHLALLLSLRLRLHLNLKKRLLQRKSLLL
jgi:hypothetical protein